MWEAYAAGHHDAVAATHGLSQEPSGQTFGQGMGSPERSVLRHGNWGGPKDLLRIPKILGN